LRKALRKIGEREIKFIFHLGDFIAPFTLREIGKYYKGELVGVFGNNDGERIGLIETSKKLGFKIEEPPFLYEVEGIRFMLHHIYPENVYLEIKGIDFVLFGHWHRVTHIRKEKTVFLNPGELCGYLTGKKSFAIIDLVTREIEIVYLD
jgi:hypothetical protein